MTTATGRRTELENQFLSALDKLPLHVQEKLLTRLSTWVRKLRDSDPLTQEAMLAAGIPDDPND